MRHPEFQYLDLLESVLERGDKRTDRTGVGTLSIFGTLCRFDLSSGQVPILTTKRVYWKTAVKEMLWFLTGGTNLQPLLKDNVRIWTDWPLDAYRKASGEAITQEAFEARIVEDDEFAKRWGELGPVYGKQWRRWQGPDGREYDQVAELLRTLKTNPTSRRMLFHAWNVPDLGSMALPPCHLVYQYHVTQDGRLNCLMYQRSCDVLLGAPFNFVGAVALQLMLAQQASLLPGEFVWVGGDVHLYLNHLDQAKEQLSREPRPLPTIRLLRMPESIDGYRIEDFEVAGYDPHPPIKGRCCRLGARPVGLFVGLPRRQRELTFNVETRASPRHAKCSQAVMRLQPARTSITTKLEFKLARLPPLADLRGDGSCDTGHQSVHFMHLIVELLQVESLAGHHA